MSASVSQQILQHYATEPAGCQGKLYAMLNQGKLAGTGKMVILPVDQGFEHGPARSFAVNPEGYDPLYHWKLAIDAGLNAFAAPLGLLELGAAQFAGQIPTILKVNSANSWGTQACQAITAGVDDALRLGCSGIGFTLYPGSEHQYQMIEQLKALTREAKAAGLAVVVWSYPRGGTLTKAGETGLDVIAYAAHLAAQLGAHIIKVKPPTAHIEQPEAAASYANQNMDTLEERVAHVLDAAFMGKRIVIFSGGAAKGTEAVLEEIQGLAAGGAFGSIIGRNAFQRPRAEALALLDQIIAIYAAAGTNQPTLVKAA